MDALAHKCGLLNALLDAQRSLFIGTLWDLTLSQRGFYSSIGREATRPHRQRMAAPAPALQQAQQAAKQLLAALPATLRES